MRRAAVFIALLCAPLFSTPFMLGDEAPARDSKESAPKVILKEPFSRMTPTDLVNTGIQKLSSGEQEALVKWWNQRRFSTSQHHITKEASITSIADGGKYIMLSDGTKISFSSSCRKKIGRWAVDDVIGLGEPGKRGSVTLYHMANGQKVKGKREQAPQKKDSTDKSKS
jgi:hypothetical protein